MEKKINIKLFGVEYINIHIVDGNGHLESNLPCEDGEDGDEQYNHNVDGMEALILALACAGVDVESKEFVSSIETALETFANNA